MVDRSQGFLAQGQLQLSLPDRSHVQEAKPSITCKCDPGLASQPGHLSEEKLQFKLSILNPFIPILLFL